MIIAPQPLRGKFPRLLEAPKLVHVQPLVPERAVEALVKCDTCLGKRYYWGMGEFQIKRVKVENFKSLADFEMRDIPMFACLIGINGCGKTTFLQFVDFVKALMVGDVKGWLDLHDLNAGELLTFGNERKKNVIEMEIDAVIDGTPASWAATFNVRELRCTAERLEEGGVAYHFNAGRLTISEQGKRLQTVDYGPSSYTGSIFSFRKTKFGQFIRETSLLGVLDPHAIAQPSRTAKSGRLTHVEGNGKNLSAFVAGLSSETQMDLFRQIHEFYSPLDEFKVKRQQFGWKSLLMRELGNAVFSATNLSYGTLRLFVLLSQQYADDKVVLCDEVENGLNQELFEKFVAKLRNYGDPPKQVFVSTHSGLCLNYLTDEQARESVFFLYKGETGRTRARRFFDIPEISEKLNVLGPGEAMGDTDLMQLSGRLAAEDGKIA